MDYKFDRCSKCGRYDWVESHVCSPTWRVKCEETYGDEELVVHARDPAEAAEQFVKEYDEEHSVLKQEWEVQVYDPKAVGVGWRTFIVSGEPSILYDTREKKYS
jgi:hypothetical protein